MSEKMRAQIRGLGQLSAEIDRIGQPKGANG
jgi:hypothetical protein